jgi:hypothetical protein
MRFTAILLLAASASASAAEPDLVRRRESFYLLRPGVTMAEIAAELGPPDSSTEGTATYRLDVGRVELTEQNGLLAQAEHRDPGEGGVSSSLYYSAPGALRPSATELEAREHRVGSRDFMRVDRWGTAFVRTERHPGGLVFLLSDGYIVLDEVSPLMGREGAFADLIARATLYRGGVTRTVWRLFDVWTRVRPSYLSAELLAAREAILARDGHLPADVLARKLGDADGRMGSGYRYDQYYLRDGLLVLPIGRTALGIKHLEQPGVEEPMTLAAWLARRRSARHLK